MDHDGLGGRIYPEHFDFIEVASNLDNPGVVKGKPVIGSPDIMSQKLRDIGAVYVVCVPILVDRQLADGIQLLIDNRIGYLRGGIEPKELWKLRELGIENDGGDCKSKETSIWKI